MANGVLNHAALASLAAVLALSAGAAPDAARPRPKTADGSVYPDAGFCTLALNLPVVHGALGGLPEAVGLRKVFSVKSGDPVVKNWVDHLTAHRIDAAAFDYVGPGLDYGAECVLVGLNGGRVDRLLFFFPRLTPARAASFTDPICKAGVAQPTDGDRLRFQVNGTTLIGSLVGGHSWTVAQVNPNSTHQNFFVREPDVTYRTDEYPSGVLLRVAPVDWYVSTHVVASSTATAMLAGRLVEGMTREQAVAMLGEPKGLALDGTGRETLTWHRHRLRPSGRVAAMLIVATFDKGAVVSFAEDEERLGAP